MDIFDGLEVTDTEDVNYWGTGDIIKGDCLEVCNKYQDKFQLVYIDPPFNTGKDRVGKAGIYGDKWINQKEYLSWLFARVEAIWDTLKDNGSLIIHVDPTISHYIKVVMDNKFGIGAYKNEIVWAYNSGGASKRHLSKKHDTLLWYVKGDNYVFNVIREPYATPNVANRAAFHPDGRMLTDVWNISFISTTSNERTGYPTQKPKALLERVVEIWSNRNDYVGDFFAGSGTTGEAAMLLGRNYVMVDENEEAINIMKQRLYHPLDDA